MPFSRTIRRLTVMMSVVVASFVLPSLAVSSPAQSGKTFSSADLSKEVHSLYRSLKVFCPGKVYSTIGRTSSKFFASLSCGVVDQTLRVTVYTSVGATTQASAKLAKVAAENAYKDDYSYNVFYLSGNEARVAKNFLRKAELPYLSSSSWTAVLTPHKTFAGSYRQRDLPVLRRIHTLLGGTLHVAIPRGRRKTGIPIASSALQIELCSANVSRWIHFTAGLPAKNVVQIRRRESDVFVGYGVKSAWNLIRNAVLGKAGILSPTHHMNTMSALNATVRRDALSTCRTLKSANVRMWQIPNLLLFAQFLSGGPGAPLPIGPIGGGGGFTGLPSGVTGLLSSTSFCGPSGSGSSGGSGSGSSGGSGSGSSGGSGSGSSGGSGSGSSGGSGSGSSGLCGPSGGSGVSTGSGSSGSSGSTS